jgi:hypothetical protein
MHRFAAYYTIEFFSPKYRNYPKQPNFTDSEDGEIKLFVDAAVEKELVACGKSIFLADEIKLLAELRYLKENFPQIRFYVGNDSMEFGLKRKLTWQFENLGTSKVAYYLKLLLQAGVRDAILSIQAHLYYLKRRSGTRLIKMGILPIPVDMKGPTQTIFIILVTITSLAFLQFLLELIYYHRKVIYLFFTHLLIVTIAICRRIFARICRNLIKWLH